MTSSGVGIDAEALLDFERHLSLRDRPGPAGGRQQTAERKEVRFDGAEPGLRVPSPPRGANSAGQRGPLLARLRPTHLSAHAAADGTTADLNAQIEICRGGRTARRRAD